jgi:hypothetical protein
MVLTNVRRMSDMQPKRGAGPQKGAPMPYLEGLTLPGFDVHHFRRP